MLKKYNDNEVEFVRSWCLQVLLLKIYLPFLKLNKMNPAQILDQSLINFLKTYDETNLVIKELNKEKSFFIELSLNDDKNVGLETAKIIFAVELLLFYFEYRASNINGAIQRLPDFIQIFQENVTVLFDLSARLISKIPEKEKTNWPIVAKITPYLLSCVRQNYLSQILTLKENIFPCLATQKMTELEVILPKELLEIRQIAFKKLQASFAICIGQIYYFLCTSNKIEDLIKNYDQFYNGYSLLNELLQFITQINKQERKGEIKEEINTHLNKFCELFLTIITQQLLLQFFEQPKDYHFLLHQFKMMATCQFVIAIQLIPMKESEKINLFTIAQQQTLFDAFQIDQEKTLPKDIFNLALNHASNIHLPDIEKEDEVKAEVEKINTQVKPDTGNDSWLEKTVYGILNI